MLDSPTAFYIQTDMKSYLFEIYEKIITIINIDNQCIDNYILITY